MVLIKPYIPLHWISVQTLVSVFVPTQLSFSKDANGFRQTRALCCRPWPHVELHTFQSPHTLQPTVIKKKPILYTDNYIEKMRICSEIINAKEEFSITLRNKFQILADIDTDSIDSKRERVKTALQSSCEEKLAYKKRTYKTRLRDYTVNKIEEKRSTRLKLCQDKNSEITSAGRIQRDTEGSKRIPDERSGIIEKLSKKGDLSDCNNWRGIQLLSLPLKIISRILLERLKTNVDKQLRDEQAGFRSRRPCTDQIACLRMNVKQSIECQSTTYINFIDLCKAFDMIKRSTIWKIMKHDGIPDKFVNNIRSFYEDMTCQVVLNSDISTPFAVTTGVRQGSLLSPMVFFNFQQMQEKTVFTRLPKQHD